MKSDFSVAVHALVYLSVKGCTLSSDALADKLELSNDAAQALPAPNPDNLLDPIRPRKEPVQQTTKTGSKTQQRIIDIDIY